MSDTDILAEVRRIAMQEGAEAERKRILEIIDKVMEQWIKHLFNITEEDLK